MDQCGSQSDTEEGSMDQDGVHNTRKLYGEREEEPETGSGMFAFVDGSKYEGEWMAVNDRKTRHGRGVFIDGEDKYEGNWKEDAMDGEGTYNFGTGARYQGQWTDNTMNGEGTYEWTDQAVYAGQWRQNKMHGQGCYTDPEGVKWEGKFLNGKFWNGSVYMSLR